MKFLFGLAIGFFLAVSSAHAQTSVIQQCPSGNPINPWVPCSATPSSTIIPNNTTAVVVKNTPGQVYGIECFNNSATIAYIKVYDATTATAGSGTPVARYMCPSSTSGAGFVVSYQIGRAFTSGITYIMTTGIADSDTAAPAANTYIVNVYYK